MIPRKPMLPAALLLSLLIALPLNTLWSAELTPAMQSIVKKLKLDEKLFDGADDEHKVPQAWLDGAKKEGKVRFFSTLDPRQANKVIVPFKERYPFIDVEYSRASHEDRAVKTLVALKSGRHLTDILTGVGGTYFMYRKADGLADLRDIPNWKNNPEGTRDPDGHWVGMHLRYWCMAYNSGLVKQEELPKKWEDLLTNPRWGNKNLALGNRPQLWMLMLWHANGEEWAKNFMTKLFTQLKPQLRKEGMNAMMELTLAGEFHANVPAGGYRAKQKALEGAPIAWTCPEPVPVAVSEMTILKGAPNINAAKIFTNWFLSKEGQIAQYAATFAPPVHKDLQREEFLPFADQIQGKKISFREPKTELEIQPELLRFWNDLWLKGGGKPRKRR